MAKKKKTGRRYYPQQASGNGDADCHKARTPILLRKRMFSKCNAVLNF